MKKTLITLLALAGVASAGTGTTTFTGGTNTYQAGTTYGDFMLTSSMTTGSGNNSAITFNPNVDLRFKDTYDGVKDHTISLWVETDSLATDCLLFACSPVDKTIGYVWDAETKTISFGRGVVTDGSFTFSSTDSKQMASSVALGDYLTGGLTNITIAVDNFNQWCHAKATIWVNGTNIGTTDMFYTDGGAITSNTTYTVGNAIYGTVALTDQVLTTTDAVASLAGAVVIPEPATATLSLLALAGLCARRRRG